MSTDRLYLGEVDWSGSVINSFLNYRYLDKYISQLTEADASGGSYQKMFEHNLGFIPSNFKLYFYETMTSTEPKVLHIGDEAVVKVTSTTLTVRNRYANLVARTFGGTVKDIGYLQLVI